MSITLPPRYVSVPVSDTYDLNLSDTHFRTLTQLRGLAWKTKGERTPPLTIEDLMSIRGLSRSKVFEHLKVLRENGYIRTELVSRGLFVICPLRWEPGTALPTDGRSTLSDDEIAALVGDTPDTNPGNGTPRPVSGIQHEHVVVDSVHDLEQKQQHVHVLSPVFGTQNDLLEKMVAILIESGANEQAAREKAAGLLDAYGAEVCGRQLEHFKRRCEIAKASQRGLENPAGLLVASIKGDWDPPSDNDRQKNRWFTDEEFEQFFEH